MPQPETNFAEMVSASSCQKQDLRHFEGSVWLPFMDAAGQKSLEGKR